MVWDEKELKNKLKTMLMWGLGWFVIYSPWCAQFMSLSLGKSFFMPLPSRLCVLTQFPQGLHAPHHTLHTHLNPRSLWRPTCSKNTLPHHSHLAIE